MEVNAHGGAAAHANSGPKKTGGVAASTTGSSKLFAVSPLEPKDELEERHERSYNAVLSLTEGRGEKEANDALMAAAGTAKPGAYEDICIGLVVGVLASSSDPDAAARHYRDLTLVSRDGMTAACAHLTQIVLEKYQRLSPGAKQQLLWLTREMIKSNVNGMENICWNLMRQVAGGDVSRPNLWLADHLLDIFIDHRAWLERFPFLLASVVYTYLRVIEDHMMAEQLRKKEVKFVASLMRDRFADITVIGRDLMRVLQYVAKIPEFEELWRDIMYNPRSLSPTFGGVVQLMQTRTSRRFLQSRITPEMEKKLVFLTSQVRFGTHKRYQDWFQRQYLATNESQTLRCDLIRFIVGVIHPTNELLGSDIIPRWAVIGWLLTTCTNQVASSNAKLALFYDWLFFSPEKDNIMNIEPAILVMHHSMRPHPAITATLLDFLCRIIDNFYPKERVKVHQGVNNSLKTILDKRVLPSLLPLFGNPRLDEELRTMLKERFPQFFGVVEGQHQAPPVLERETAHDDENAPRFSDDEEEKEASADDEDSKPVAKMKSSASNSGKKKRQQQQQSKNSSKAKKTEKEPKKESNEVDEVAKEALKDLKTETNAERRCELVQKVAQTAIQEDYGYEQCDAVAQRLAEVLADDFEGRIFPEENDDVVRASLEAVEDSVGRPIFVLLRAVCEMKDGDQGRDVLIQIMADLYALQPRLGYYLLFFLTADKTAKAMTVKEKAATYRDLCEAIDDKFSMDICLVNDMRQCLEDGDISLFVHILPSVYSGFPKHAIGNTDLLYLVVSCVDGRQITQLSCMAALRELVMFKRDSFASVLSDSLNWETFEQYAFWHLVMMHPDLPVADCLVSVLPRMKAPRHSEALMFSMQRLRREKPTADTLRAVLARDVKDGDLFASSVLQQWMEVSRRIT